MMKSDPAWAGYYRETEPSRRRQLLYQLVEQAPDDSVNPLRIRLFALRHTDPQNPDHEIDRILWQCVSFIQVCASARFFRNRARKDVEASLSAIGYDEMSGYSDPGERAMYWEIRNGARRYFKTCSDSGYHRALFGLVSSSDNDRLRQMKKDVREMTVVLSERLRYFDRLRIWNQAVIDEYGLADPQGAAELRKEIPFV